MKTDRISLIILAVEIVLITALHSARSEKNNNASELVKSPTVQTDAAYSSFSLIGLKR